MKERNQSLYEPKGSLSSSQTRITFTEYDVQYEQSELSISENPTEFCVLVYIKQTVHSKLDLSKFPSRFPADQNMFCFVFAIIPWFLDLDSEFLFSFRNKESLGISTSVYLGNIHRN